MNYRHIYHAGNMCDVVKHALLAQLILQYRAKETPFCVIDTHAGIGLYDLNDPRAQKTNEAANGIDRLLKAQETPEVSDYLNIVRALNSGQDTRLYPGSPMLARRLLRQQDKLIACERHSDDILELKKLFHNDKRVHAHHRDGYEALRALLPPQEKRGIVFIDPPFEQPDEFRQLSQALTTCNQKWRQACVVIWYPVKERPAIWRFHEEIIATGLPDILYAEFVFDEESRADRLNGSGFIVMNSPWQFDKTINKLFTHLHSALETNNKKTTLAWLRDPI